MQRSVDAPANLVPTVPALSNEHSPPCGPGCQPTVEFGRFTVLLRERQLLADGVSIKLGARTFDLLLVLLEADGALVTKNELLGRVWPGIIVTEENLKVQIAALRRALGEDRDSIRTEVGRGYRFTAQIRRIVAPSAPHRPTQWLHRSAQCSATQWKSRVTPRVRMYRSHRRRRASRGR